MRIHQFLIALDQAMNTLTPDGWAGETLSAHAWRARGRSRVWAVLRRAIDGAAWVLLGQRGHCQDAFEGECNQINDAPEARHQEVPRCRTIAR